MYDVAIIGLGPAGATLARLLGGHLKVAAIDKKREGGGGFQKPCGGLLAPDAQKALARFQLTLPKKIIVDPQIFSVRTIDLDTNLTRYYQRFYVNIDRHKFDTWLREIIPQSVDIYGDTECSRVERTAAGFRISCRKGGEEHSLEAKYIVGADGANSIVRKSFFPQKKLKSYVSVQQWFKATNVTPFYSCVFDSENTDCYSWSIFKDGYFIFGGAYPAENCRRRFENQKEKLLSRGFFFGEPVKTEGCLVLRPSSPGDFCCGGEGVFLIGEAAGFVSPSSLEGISSGINSAACLSKVLVSGVQSPNKAYNRKTLSIRLKLTYKLLKCPFLFNPFLRRLVMKSGLDSIEIIG